MNYRFLLFLLKTSRPGLWFATIWLYILPASQNTAIFTSWIFWLGLFYVCFPLNLLVYGWNDIVDKDADRINPRKGNYLFGSLGTDSQLKQLTRYIVLSQAVFYPFFIYVAGFKILIVLGIQLIVLYLYNMPENGWRSKPPLELSCQIGYLLLVPFSIWLNDLSHVSILAYIYLSLFAIQSHLIGEVMDIDPDRKAGITTTATRWGTKNTKLLIIGIVSMEAAIIYFGFGDIIFTAMLLFALLWFILDLLVLYKNKRYTMGEMRLFAFSSNLIAFASMVYVWWSACIN